MTYYVIGLMSGSSLDGLDIVHTSITYVSGKWEYEINYSDCISLSTEWREKLSNAKLMPVPEFLQLHTAFGRFIADAVNAFKEKHDLLHKIHFIASHGHTIWHDPDSRTTSQIGDGATIAALTGYTTISDLRNMDVALGGQGAPIVPIADRLLFSDYDFCLNLGGIANITVNKLETLAFDICPANQILNALAAQQNLDYDEGGQLAASGSVDQDILHQLNQLGFYAKPFPKSLDNGFVKNHVLALFSGKKTADALATATRHIVDQTLKAISHFHIREAQEKILVTGGGAFNRYLITQLTNTLKENSLDIEVVVPDETLIKFKEALAMALIGILRWREEENVLQSVTGASRNSIGGAMWLGA